MPESQYRNTHSWQSVIELGPKLVRLAEDLPAHEQTGLVMQLHQLMVELPAMVASDLVSGTALRFLPLYRLTAALELVERVYPALDAGDAKHALADVALRLGGPSFAESITPVLPVTPEGDVGSFRSPGAAPVHLQPGDTAEPITAVSSEVSEPSDHEQTNIQPQQVNTIHVQPSSSQ